MDKRLIILFSVLAYDTDYKTRNNTYDGYLTICHRIMINQERASLMAGKTDYQQPKEVEEKIKFIRQLMTNENTTSAYYSYVENQFK
jgi:hypothetical protein